MRAAVEHTSPSGGETERYGWLRLAADIIITAAEGGEGERGEGGRDDATARRRRRAAARVAARRAVGCSAAARQGAVKM